MPILMLDYEPVEENGVTFYVFKYSFEPKLNPDASNDATSSKAPAGWSLIALNQGLKENAADTRQSNGQ